VLLVLATRIPSKIYLLWRNPLGSSAPLGGFFFRLFDVPWAGMSIEGTLIDLDYGYRCMFDLSTPIYAGWAFNGVSYFLLVSFLAPSSFLGIDSASSD
jgi:hypothetical protein